MIYTIYNGSALSSTPLTAQINLPVGLQSFRLDFRHDSDSPNGGLTFEYWGQVLTDTVNGLVPPKVGYTSITTGIVPESKIITIGFGVPVNVVQFAATSAGNRKLFVAVVSESDY